MFGKLKLSKMPVSKKPRKTERQQQVVNGKVYKHPIISWYNRIVNEKFGLAKAKRLAELNGTV